MRCVCGDCRVIMAAMPDQCAVGVADAPYALGIDYESDEDTPENSAALGRELVPLLRRVCECSLVTAGTDGLWLWPKPEWVLAWHIKNSHSYCSWGFLSWQRILAYGRDPYLRRGLGCRPTCYLDENSVERKTGLHPCPKDLAITTWLIERAAPDRESLILDPLCGSGSTLVAANQLGRRYIGIDISPKYCELAAERVRNTTPPLFT